MCQWLPIYELTEENLKSVVRTFQRELRARPGVADPQRRGARGQQLPDRDRRGELARRIGRPEVLADLQRVRMGSAADFLGYFVTGTAGAAAYGRGGVLNTDDNLYLEFSAPLSIEKADLIPSNLAGLVAHRESLLPYLRAPASEADRARQEARCGADLEAASVVDRVRAHDFAGRFRTSDYPRLIAEVDRAYSWYAPWRFLRDDFTRRISQEPRIVQEAALPVTTADGNLAHVRLGAVTRRMTDEITTLDFVDGSDGTVLGRHEILGAGMEPRTAALVATAMANLQAAYLAAAREASARGERAPRAATLLPRLRRVLADTFARADGFPGEDAGR